MAFRKCFLALGLSEKNVNVSKTAIISRYTLSEKNSKLPNYGNFFRN